MTYTLQAMNKPKANADLFVCRGSYPPDVVLPLPDWQPAEHPGSLEEVGPLVEHVYEVRLTKKDHPIQPHSAMLSPNLLVMTLMMSLALLFS